MLYVDDRLPRHPKILNAGRRLGGSDGAARAIALYLDGLAYTRGYLLDGFIPETFLAQSPLVRDPRKVAGALVEAKLWRKVDGGYRIHDFSDYNPTAAEVATRRGHWRDKKRKQRKKNGEFSQQSPGDIQGTNGGPRASAREPVPVPVPVPGDNCEYLEIKPLAVRTGSLLAVAFTARSARGTFALKKKARKDHAAPSEFRATLRDHVRANPTRADYRRRRMGCSDQDAPRAIAFAVPETARAHGGHASRRANAHDAAVGARSKAA